MAEEAKLRFERWLNAQDLQDTLPDDLKTSIFKLLDRNKACRFNVNEQKGWAGGFLDALQHKQLASLPAWIHRLDPDDLATDHVLCFVHHDLLLLTHEIRNELKAMQTFEPIKATGAFQCKIVQTSYEVVDPFVVTMFHSVNCFQCSGDQNYYDTRTPTSTVRVPLSDSCGMASLPESWKLNRQARQAPMIILYKMGPNLEPGSTTYKLVDLPGRSTSQGLVRVTHAMSSRPGQGSFSPTLRRMLPTMPYGAMPGVRTSRRRAMARRCWKSVRRH